MRFKLALLTLACVLLALSYPYLSSINYSKVETTTIPDNSILGKFDLGVGKAGLWFEAKAKIKSSLILNNNKEIEVIDPFESSYSSLFDSNFFIPKIIFYKSGSSVASASGTFVYQRDGNYARYFYAYFPVPSQDFDKIVYSVYDASHPAVSIIASKSSLPNNAVLAFKITEYGAYFGGSYSNLLNLSASYVMLLGFPGGSSNVRLLKPDNNYVNPSSATVIAGDNDGTDCIINDTPYNCHIGVAVVITYSSSITIKEVQLFTSKDTSTPVTRLVFNSPVTLNANQPLVIYVDYYVQ